MALYTPAAGLSAAPHPGKIHPFRLMDVTRTAANLKPIDAAGTAIPEAVYFKMVDRFRDIHRIT